MTSLGAATRRAVDRPPPGTRGDAAALAQQQDAVVVTDRDERVLDWNVSAEELFGWTREEARGRVLRDLIGTEAQRAMGRGGITGADPRASGSAPSHRIEMTVRHRDGAPLSVDGSVSVLEVGDERILTAVLHDAVERRRADTARRHLAAIVEESHDAVISLAPDGTIQRWNAGAEQLYGYRPEEMIGASIARLQPGGRALHLDDVRRRLEAGESVRDVRTLRLCCDGSLTEVFLAAVPAFDVGGRLTGISCIERDVAPDRGRPALGDEVEGRFAKAFGMSPVGMALVTIDGRLFEVNDALCAFLGRPREELTQIKREQLTHPDDVGIESDLERQLLAGERSSYAIDKRYLRGDGHAVWGYVCVSLVRARDGEPSYLVVQVLDIEARRQAEAQLGRQSSELHRLERGGPATSIGHHPSLRAAIVEQIGSAPDDPFGLVIVALRRLDDARAAAELMMAGVATAIPGSRFMLLPGAGVGMILPGADDAAARAAGGRIGAAAAGIRPTGPVPVAAASWSPNESPDDLIRRLVISLGDAPAPGAARGALEPDVAGRITRMLAHARRTLGMKVAYLAEVAGSTAVCRAVDAEPGDAAVAARCAGILASTCCPRMLEGRLPHLIGDVARSGDLRDLAAIGTAGTGCYLGVPVHLDDGRVYGSLGCSDSVARPDIGVRELASLRFLAELVGDLLSQSRTNEDRRRTETERSGVNALLMALEARDSYTGGHSRDVVELATGVATRLGLGVAEVGEVEQVALLHDIGKVGVPDAVLQKRGPLSGVEWDLMREHPAIGERILGGLPGLAHLAPAIRAEHERFDGAGYPDGLRGDEIPVASRIAFACDAFHAMTSDRPYRPAMPAARARAELLACAGSQFDPDVVEALVAVIAERPAPPRGA